MVSGQWWVFRDRGCQVGAEPSTWQVAHSWLVVWWWGEHPLIVNANLNMMTRTPYKICQTSEMPTTMALQGWVRVCL